MWFRFASSGYLGSFPPILYLFIIPGETATHVCGAVDGCPMFAWQAIEDDARTVAGSDFWAGTIDPEVNTITGRSNNRIIRGVYN
jgi:hypothetical protein